MSLLYSRNYANYLLSFNQGKMMTARAVIRMGHPNLRKVAELVDLKELKSSDFKTLLTDMYDTMKKEGGIGIAAPQINVSKQICMIELPESSDRYGDLGATPLFIIINPTITVVDKTHQGFWEGCLSVPGLRGFVERPRAIEVSYINELGEYKKIHAEDFLATVFQHELDHLFGKLYVDRITDMTKLSYVEEFAEFNAAKKEDALDE
jgi:peptide deformylase